MIKSVSRFQSFYFKCDICPVTFLTIVTSIHFFIADSLGTVYQNSQKNIKPNIFQVNMNKIYMHTDNNVVFKENNYQSYVQSHL